MTVTFGNAGHLATVWLPELTPTTGKVVSTIIAMLAMAAVVTLVAAIFAVFCLEKGFTWLRVAATFVGTLVVMVACAGGTQHITGTNAVHGASPAPTQDAALTAARQAATPNSSWTEHARGVSATGRRVQSGWTKTDLQKISNAVASSQGMRLGYAGAPAMIETTHLTDAYIAAHGTPFFKGSTELRCAVKLDHLVKNNVGQPVSAHIAGTHCLPAASPAPAKKS